MTEQEAPAEKSEEFNPRDPKHYKFWKRALAMKASGEKVTIPADDPQCGFYETADAKGERLPVAIWYKTNKSMACLVGKVSADVLDTWAFCADKPIPQADYRTVYAGEPWPERRTVDTKHNRPPSDEAGFKEDAEGKLNELRAFLEKNKEITDQADADKLDLYLKECRAFAKKADDQRKAEKEPHLKMGREVDDAWQPLIKRLRAAADTCKARITPFLQKKAEKAKEIEAENPGIKVAKPTAGAENRVDGKKRATHLRPVFNAEITDPPKAAAHFANNPKVLDVIKSLALAEFHTTKADPPGCKITESKAAR